MLTGGPLVLPSFFQPLAADIDARCNDVPDAYLAAYALEKRDVAQR